MDFKLTNGVADLLTIKFEYLKQASDTDLFLELIPLHQILLETPAVFNVIYKSLIELNNENKNYYEAEKQIAEELKALKERFIAMFPELDDSNYQTSFREDDPTSFLNTDYLFTFKRFDNLLNGVITGLDKCTPVERPDRYENQTLIYKAINVLLGKWSTAVNDHQDRYQDPLFQQYFVDQNNLSETYNYLFRKLINYHRVSLGAEFHLLHNLIKEINPEPRILTKFEDLYDSPQPYVLRPLAYQPIRDAIYKGTTPDPEQVKEVRQHLDRMYYGILSGLSQNLLHEQVVLNFKTRCMWYDKERIRGMLLDSEGNLIRDKEDTLIKEMARYLFDNGFPVLFHIQTENLQTDLMDPSIKYPLLIEGKAYKTSCKDELLRGIAQLHGYLNNFESQHYYIRDAYYVVFRIRGPLYDFPTEIITNRYRIIPVLIDLGDSSVSGSRQESQPVIIKIEEIIQEIEKQPDEDAEPYLT